MNQDNGSDRNGGRTSSQLPRRQPDNGANLPTIRFEDCRFDGAPERVASYKYVDSGIRDPVQWCKHCIYEAFAGVTRRDSDTRGFFRLRYAHLHDLLLRGWRHPTLTDVRVYLTADEELQCWFAELRWLKREYYHHTFIGTIAAVGENPREKERVDLYTAHYEKVLTRIEQLRGYIPTEPRLLGWRDVLEHWKPLDRWGLLHAVHFEGHRHNLAPCLERLLTSARSKPTAERFAALLEVRNEFRLLQDWLNEIFEIRVDPNERYGYSPDDFAGIRSVQQLWSDLESEIDDAQRTMPAQGGGNAERALSVAQLVRDWWGDIDNEPNRHKAAEVLMERARREFPNRTFILETFRTAIREEWKKQGPCELGKPRVGLQADESRACTYACLTDIKTGSPACTRLPPPN